MSCENRILGDQSGAAQYEKLGISMLSVFPLNAGVIAGEAPNSWCTSFFELIAESGTISRLRRDIDGLGGHLCDRGS
jgi:hypothetical protein